MGIERSKSERQQSVSRSLGFPIGGQVVESLREQGWLAQKLGIGKCVGQNQIALGLSLVRYGLPKLLVQQLVVDSCCHFAGCDRQSRFDGGSDVQDLIVYH